MRVPRKFLCKDWPYAYFLVFLFFHFDNAKRNEPQNINVSSNCALDATDTDISFYMHA